MKRIMIDTDIGLGTPNAEIDDGLAISYAISKPKEIRIEGITTIYGNVAENHAYKNVRSLLETLNSNNIPVNQGAQQPLRDMQHTEPTAQGAASQLIEVVRANPQEIMLVCIGPLTNIATALIMEPDVFKKVNEVYIMGGAIMVPGNITPTAEFNIYSDPIAAKIVFNSGMPMALVPLDVTTKTLITRKHVNTLKSVGGGKLDYLVEWIEPWLRFQEQTFGLEGGNLHDPLTVAIAIDSTLAKMKQMSVDVETTGEMTRGMTVADRRDFVMRRVPNVSVCEEIDEPSFMKQFIDSLKSLGQE